MSDYRDTNNYEREFRQLFDTYKVRVHDYVYTITGDEYVAEEITQELFIKLWKKIKEQHPINDFDHYIFRMARNASMSYFSKVALDAKLAEKLKRKMTVADNPTTDQLDVKEMQRLINNAVSSLSPQRRKVYELSRVQGLKLDEIANELHLSVNTVKNHLVESLKQIREYLIANSADPLMLFLVLSYQLLIVNC